MSDESAPDVTWEDIADSWRVDELLEGRMRPTTYDDVLTLITIGVLRGPLLPPSETARRRAFDAMMCAAAGSTARAKISGPHGVCPYRADSFGDAACFRRGPASM
ncbi:hypothetical protein G3I48_17825 [Streptomyces griseus]|uniref:hypothetical protein n=1 Tax=Streptomyces griseus TaxID=1911 RepID=UPI0013B7E008|nr:hypothetical protein [Streptomyces griseus]